MTHGQDRAVRELQRLHVISGGGFEFQLLPKAPAPWTAAAVSIRLGSMDFREGGLQLHEREDFVLYVPADYPFESPSLVVTHDRFAGFPHVIWGRGICIYQSELEWNPADGLYGFLERLRAWLVRAAVNDMDPVEGPLEPPHYVTDSSQVPFVIRANAPVPSGQAWFGLAELKKCPNRTELVGWREVEDWPAGRAMALAVVLPKALPMEFPRKGTNLFRELDRQGVDRARIIRFLSLAALVTPIGEPVHLIAGLPMRRGPDGSEQLHLAVWSTDGGFAESLRLIIGQANDSDALRSLRQGLGERLLACFEATDITWCQVLEDRSEIVIRRDASSRLAWFLGKRVLVLGCGALGSWAAEMAIRAGAAAIDLVDNGMVKPGLLVRQNFTLEDIGANKAKALAGRLRAIATVAGGIQFFDDDANQFIAADSKRFSEYDVVLDCTASAMVQMKLERDWTQFGGRTPAFVSMGTDAKAEFGLCIGLPPKAAQGPWDGYIRLKNHLCTSGRRPNHVAAFYEAGVMQRLFQPEPGCSEPTFSGSVSDSTGIAGTALSLAATHSLSPGKAVGIAFALPTVARPEVEIGNLDDMREVPVGAYRVRIAGRAMQEARGWVRQNSRLRSPEHETGGLIWGLWDDSIGVIWIFDASGPPSDSRHDAGHFVCGVEGTAEEHRRRLAWSRGTAGFIGFWHTHPDMPSKQSEVDLRGMAGLVSAVQGNQRRAIMLIFGRKAGKPTAGIYVYESRAVVEKADFLEIGGTQLPLDKAVV